MPDLSFYRKYDISAPEDALKKFIGTLQTYYDVDYYVGWKKVYANASRFKRDLLLLSSLCDEPDKEQAARALLHDYPQVIPVIPLLMAVRVDERCPKVYVLEDINQLKVKTYDFSPHAVPPTEAEIETYVHFLLTSGLLELLSRIKHLPDYITGVEVGMDTNARKNRSGDCAIRALTPAVNEALKRLPDVDSKAQANYRSLTSEGCVLPKCYKRKIWDWAFWTRNAPRRFAVVEVNHYGGSGSKPESIVGEYLARQQALDAAGVGFVWVTDGYGWLKMIPALTEVFEVVEHLINIRLAKEGQLEWALRRLLLTDAKGRQEHAA